jgi:hypothetical protein
MARKQRKGPRGEHVGMRVRCTLPFPATLSGLEGELVREIQNGRQWLIQFDPAAIPARYATTYPGGVAWLWTCDFEPAD